MRVCDLPSNYKNRIGSALPSWKGEIQVAVQCPYCDADLAYTVDGDGTQIEMAPWDVAVCACCTQFIQATDAGTLIRFSDDALRALREMDPDFVEELETAQRLLRQFDRRRT